MPQAVWKGAIRFGLVHIPVGLYPAESPDALDLDLLDRRTMAPIGYRKVNRETGREVPGKAIVKGYRLKSGKYVVLTDQDLRRASPEATRTLDIVGFVAKDEVSSIYFDKPYYLAPLAQGDKPYALLREALGRSERMGIARLVVRTRGYVAAVYPRDRVLVAHLLRYEHELRAAVDLDLPATGVARTGLSPKELDMAERLIAGMEMSWRPESYRDDYRDQLLALVRRKARAGKASIVEEAEPEGPKTPGAEVIDLMALLKGSLAKPDSGRRRRLSRPARARRATA